jgi:hypothetical protein
MGPSRPKGGRPTLAEKAGYDDDTVPIAVKVPLRLKHQLKAQARKVGIRLPDFIRGLFEQAVQETQEPEEAYRDGKNDAA